MSPWISVLTQRSEGGGLVTCWQQWIWYTYVTVDWLEYSSFHLLETCDVCDKRRRKARGTRGWFSCYMQGINLSSLSHHGEPSYGRNPWLLWQRFAGRWLDDVVTATRGGRRGKKCFSQTIPSNWDFAPYYPNLLQKTTKDRNQPWLPITLGLVERSHVSQTPSLYVQWEYM